MGYFIYYVGGMGNVVKMTQFCILGHFGNIWATITNIVYKIPNKLYIYVIYSSLRSCLINYKTLKSNNFEKLTYNANMIFLNAKNARLKMVRSEKNFFCGFFMSIVFFVVTRGIFVGLKLM